MLWILQRYDPASGYRTFVRGNTIVAVEIYKVNKFSELLNHDPDVEILKMNLPSYVLENPIVALVLEEMKHYIWNSKTRLWGEWDQTGW